MYTQGKFQDAIKVKSFNFPILLSLQHSSVLEDGRRNSEGTFKGNKLKDKVLETLMHFETSFLKQKIVNPEATLIGPFN